MPWEYIPVVRNEFLKAVLALKARPSKPFTVDNEFTNKTEINHEADCVINKPWSLN